MERKCAVDLGSTVAKDKHPGFPVCSSKLIGEQRRL